MEFYLDGIRRARNEGLIVVAPRYDADPGVLKYSNHVPWQFNGITYQGILSLTNTRPLHPVIRLVIYLFPDSVIRFLELGPGAGNACYELYRLAKTMGKQVIVSAASYSPINPFMPIVLSAFGHNNDQNPTDKPLVWVDSKGKTIGRAVGGDSGGRNAVQVKVHRLSLIVPVGNKTECAPGQFPFNCDLFLAVTWGVGGLFFEDTECKGKAYVNSLFAGSDRAVGQYRQTLYIGDSQPKSKAVTYKAVVVNGVCDSNVSPPPFNTPPGWEVEKTLGLWTLGFKPPFYLK